MRSYRLDGGRHPRRRQNISNPVETEVMSRHELYRKLSAARDLGVVSVTKVVKLSQWADWKRFCGVWKVDSTRFGSLGANAEEAVELRLQEGLDTFLAFAAFIVFSPRAKSVKHITNSVTYAEKVLSSIRCHYESIHGLETWDSGRRDRWKEVVLLPAWVAQN